MHNYYIIRVQLTNNNIYAQIMACSILDRRENINIKNIVHLIQTRITFNKTNCFDSFFERIEFRHSDTPL